MRILLPLLGLVAAAGVATTAAAAAPEAPTYPTAQAAPTLTVRSSAWGRILFDGRGRALYAFTRDSRGRTTCFGGCAAAWPPYVVRGAVRPGAGVQGARLATIRRPDGSRQVTYNGWPLYYYVGDRRPGQVSCQNVFGFGGLWLVVRPNGTLVR